jgi:hypothetical protein
MNISNNSYDFFGRPSDPSPFDGLFDQTGLRKSSGVRPVRDILREASPIIPDISNYESGLSDGGVSGVGGDVEVGGDFSGGEGIGGEFVEDTSGVNVFNDLEVEPTGMEVHDGLNREKGIKINKATSFNVTLKNVSRETKRAQSDPYLHDLDNESMYASNHPQDYDVEGSDFKMLDARGKLLNLNIPDDIKEYLLNALNNHFGFKDWNPYLHDLDDEAMYLSNHAGDRNMGVGEKLLNVRGKLLNLEISDDIKDFFLSELNKFGETKKASSKGSGVGSVTWRAAKGPSSCGKGKGKGKRKWWMVDNRDDKDSGSNDVGGDVSVEASVVGMRKSSSHYAYYRDNPEFKKYLNERLSEVRDNNPYFMGDADAAVMYRFEEKCLEEFGEMKKRGRE